MHHLAKNSSSPPCPVFIPITATNIDHHCRRWWFSLPNTGTKRALPSFPRSLCFLLSPVSAHTRRGKGENRFFLFVPPSLSLGLFSSPVFFFPFLSFDGSHTGSQEAADASCFFYQILTSQYLSPFPFLTP